MRLGWNFVLVSLMPTRFRSIDALRGFAALWVFAYHLWNAFFPGYTRQADPREVLPLDADTPLQVLATLPVVGFGYAGIGLFFVLSGFCIHLPQAKRFHCGGADGLELRPFATRRFWRLYPAFFASLFLASLAYFTMNICWRRPLGEGGLSLAYILDSSGFGWLGVNALFLLPLDPQALALNGVYWTLLYEVQFYLVYPLLLKLCRRWGFAPVGGLLLLAELLFATVPTPGAFAGVQENFQWFFLRRYFEWFLGMALAERLAAGRPFSRGNMGWLAFAGFAAGIAGTLHPLSWAVHEIALAVGSCGVVGFLIARPVDSLAVRGFGWFGDFSYSLYLVHMPILRMVFALETLLPTTVREAGSFTAAGGVCLLAVPAVAWLLYRFVEKPYMLGLIPTPAPQLRSPPHPQTSLPCQSGIGA